MDVSPRDWLRARLPGCMICARGDLVLGKKISYAQSMLAATSPEMLVPGMGPTRRTGVSQEQVVRMEREMSNLLDRYRLAETTYRKMSSI
jgi:hypothetical protein